MNIKSSLIAGFLSLFAVAAPQAAPLELTQEVLTENMVKISLVVSSGTDLDSWLLDYADYDPASRATSPATSGDFSFSYGAGWSAAPIVDGTVAAARGLGTSGVILDPSNNKFQLTLTYASMATVDAGHVLASFVVTRPAGGQDGALSLASFQAVPLLGAAVQLVGGNVDDHLAPWGSWAQTMVAPANPVPEASTTLMMLFGAGLLILRRRRAG